MKKIFLLLFSGLLYYGALAQTPEKFTISGYIEDEASGEKLLGVNVFDSKSKLGGTTNTYGFYSLTLPRDSVYLAISYVGYQTEYLGLLLDKDLTLNIKLSNSVSLEEVVVVAEELERIEEDSRMSTVEVPIETIKSIPALLGEVDVLKALQLLPGVQSGGEGQSGLYVRGGSPDQNLILLDGVPVYNASHLFGFFSVFNADAIKDVSLTKGGFPARYGGRLSSVIEIGMKEGDLNQWHGTAAIGLIASKATIEGPLIKDKTSIIVSARRTYIDILARPFIQQGFSSNSFDGSTSEGVAGYFFYDVNAKINHKFSDKDRVYLSMYTGRDRFYFTEKYTDDYTNPNGRQEQYTSQTDLGLGWGNLTAAARWNHLWNNKLFSNTTITFSRYNFDTSAGDESTETIEGQTETQRFNLNYLSGINDVAAKIDFDFVPNPNHYIRFGLSVIHHTFKPGEFDLDVLSEGDETFALDTVLGQPPVTAQEYALYVEDDFRIGRAFKANLGLHLSAFHVDSKFYASLQPRVSMRYLLPNSIALKGSFATMRQYVQLLTNEGIGLPTDLWLPTTDRILPQDSWQAAIGVAKTIRKEYEVSVEAYYKEMTNIVSYKEGASLFQLDDWQDRVTQGNGTSYGAEFLLQKKRGRLTGWIGYTLSWSFRQFDDINFGREYPFKYDRRHDISVVATYKINERIRVAGTFVYGTGNAVTLANSRYRGNYPSIYDSFDNFQFTNWNEFEYYEDRNNFRMRDYVRLDVGVDFVKKKRRHVRTFTIGVYNATNRKNPFFLYVDSDFNPQTGQSDQVLKQASLFPIIPSVSWKFEW
ncbi:MAG: TonB-dependent receptor [Bacteroidota bacterium]